MKQLNFNLYNLNSYSFLFYKVITLNTQIYRRQITFIVIILWPNCTSPTCFLYIIQLYAPVHCFRKRCKYLHLRFQVTIKCWTLNLPFSLFLRSYAPVLTLEPQCTTGDWAIAFYSSLFLHISTLEKHLYQFYHWMSGRFKKQTRKIQACSFVSQPFAEAARVPSELVLILWKKFILLNQPKNKDSFKPKGEREERERQMSA